MTLSSGALAIIRRLNSSGYHAYVVGGSTRDALRGVAPHDYDMTTDATPEEMKAVFCDHRVIETGIRHGTLTILAEGDAYEVTTYRVDGDYRDHRHPDAVTFTRALEEDLARRDFTMNAIAYHPEEGYIDPFGGIADIEGGRIRAVGDPRLRFEEDALRILRAIRFAAVLGYTIEPATADAAFETRALLAHVSAERIREELCRLLVGTHAAEVIQAYFPILASCLPAMQAPDTRTLRALTLLPPEPILRLVCLLLPTVGENHERMAEIMTALRFDNHSRDCAVKLIAHIHTPLAPCRGVMLRLLSALGSRLTGALCALRIALAETDEERARLRAARRLPPALLLEHAPYRISDLAVTGADLLAETSLRGPAIGRALHALLEATMDGEVENTRPALLAYLKARQ